MEAFVPGYNPVLAVLPLLLSLLPHGSSWLFPGRRFLVLGNSSSRWRNTFTSVALIEIGVRGLCAQGTNPSNAFSFTVSFSDVQEATNFLHKLCTGYLTEHAAVNTFKIYSSAVFPSKMQRPPALPFSDGKRQKMGELCVFVRLWAYSTCAADPKCVLIS